MDNIWVNPLETVNGIDDDGNGFVDDVYGWDFANDDNDAFDDGDPARCQAQPRRRQAVATRWMAIM